ncbi:MAG: type II toxin-antitoxin system RelE/ParE family toxin [Thermodesulfobacteriota bacterium]
MPTVELILYKEEDNTVPVISWLRSLPRKPRDKCIVKMERLRDHGHELRRPEADYLRDGIYELRVRFGTVNYRLLYFFYGTAAVVISHGVIKDDKVPAGDINKAVDRKSRFERNPLLHAFPWENL